MVKIENDCCDCPDKSMGCYCYLCNSLHFYCDECGNDVESLHQYDNEQLCDDCFKDRLFTDFTYNYPIIDNDNYNSYIIDDY